MNSLLFSSFKKKSLILTYTIYPEEIAEMLEKIRNKKLYQCIQKEEFSKILEEKNIGDNYILCLVKLTSKSIATGNSNHYVK